MSKTSMPGDQGFHRTVATWEDLAAQWGGLHNFLLGGSLARSSYQPPPLERIVEEVRRDPGSLVRGGVKGAVFDLTDIGEKFRALPLQEALRQRFVLAHFRLHPNLTGPGQVFAGLEEQWVEPWRQELLAHGFTFNRVFVIVFASGPDSASNYHMDYTHQLAWQIHGVKHFHGLKDPDRWTTHEQRGRCELKGTTRPAGITPADVYDIVQGPGTLLWNAVTTPHWVETEEGCAATLTLVHDGLRLNGQLCPHAQEAADWRAQNQQAAPDPAQAVKQY